MTVLLSSRPGRSLDDPRGHFMKVLALALDLDDKVLALALAAPGLGLGFRLERKVLALAFARPRPRLFPQDPGHVVIVRVCSTHTYGVTWQSVISCLTMLQRLACELDVGCTSSSAIAETALQGVLVITKSGRLKLGDHCDIIGLQSYRIRWKKRKIRPIRRSRSFKVIQVGTNQKPLCDFL